MPSAELLAAQAFSREAFAAADAALFGGASHQRRQLQERVDLAPFANPPYFGPLLNDLEAPGALYAAAAAVARTVGDQKEIILMATGPDKTSVQMTNNSLVSLGRLGLRPHVMLLADQWTTCEDMLRSGNCYWSSRMLRAQPSDSLTNRQFWKGWRFPFYYLKKKYMADLVNLGFSVLQVDTDTVWMHDPFTMLRLMTKSSLVAMRDVGLANAGILYARPGVAASRLLGETAWRIQMMTNWPEVVPKLVRFAQTPPFYANSDDQTLLNDAIVSAVLGNRTFLGSTARYEARNRYNPRGLDWAAQPESKEEGLQMRRMWKKSKYHAVSIPWADSAALSSEQCKADKKACPPQQTRHWLLPVEGTDDAVCLASRTLFAHLPFAPQSAITHLTAARGFAAKVAALHRISAWMPDADQWGGKGSEGFQSVKTKPKAAGAGKAAGSGGGGKGGGRAQSTKLHFPPKSDEEKAKGKKEKAKALDTE